MKQAVQWLKHEKQMLQKDIAEKMGMTDVSFSRGMERIKHKSDEDFIIKFHQATDEIFSLDWLLNGTGDKFDEQAQPQEPRPVIDESSMINAIIASHNVAIAAKDETIASLQARIVELERTIVDKETIIKDREARIVALERQLAANVTSDLERYPFAFGAAEDEKRKRV
jgi:hypothetical protein